jgi:glycosyltransferase involved in cell wall biosynthesis
LDVAGTDTSGVAPDRFVRRRFASYYGATRARHAALAGVVGSIRPDAVIFNGMDVLPYFPPLTGCVRVWLACDDQSWRYLALLRRNPTNPIGYLRAAGIMALYERSHARFVDRAWVVTSRDRRAMRWLGGMKTVDLIRTGVDCNYFRPSDTVPADHSAIFWGRLDFEANVQALRWFCGRVWPELVTRFPRARFTIAGAGATDEIRQLGRRPGIVVLEDLPDLRPDVYRSRVVIMPFVSTGGLKNKMLEAAALGKAIVCTPPAIEGLYEYEAARLTVVRSAAAFVQGVAALWEDDERCRQAGEAARAWVTTRHTWRIGAQIATATLTRG